MITFTNEMLRFLIFSIIIYQILKSNAPLYIWDVYCIDLKRVYIDYHICLKEIDNLMLK